MAVGMHTIIVVPLLGEESIQLLPSIPR